MEIGAYQQACPIYQLVDDCGIMGGMALCMIEGKAPKNTWCKTSQKEGKGRWNLEPSGIEWVLKQVWFFMCDQNLVHFCTINCYWEEIGIYQLFLAYRHFQVELSLVCSRSDVLLTIERSYSILFGLDSGIKFSLFTKENTYTKCVAFGDFARPPATLRGLRWLCEASGGKLARRFEKSTWKYSRWVYVISKLIFALMIRIGGE